jgi:hypothetical protein
MPPPGRYTGDTGYVGTRLPAILAGLERDKSWLARRSGLSAQQVGEVIRGRRRITPNFVTRVSAALHLPPDAIFIRRADLPGGGRVSDDDRPALVAAPAREAMPMH